MPEYGHHSRANGDQVNAELLTYAIGDIHGSLSKLRSLLARCADHAQGRPTTFVFLGDYIDRGPDSAGVVRYVIELQSRLREHVIALKGNHEAVALGVIDGTMPADYWLTLGGAATLRSYGVSRAQALPVEHVDWLRSLRSSYDDGRRFFVHAGIDPELPLDAQREHDMLWIRRTVLLQPARLRPPHRTRSHAARARHAGTARQPVEPRYRSRVRRPADGGGLCRR